MGLALNDQIINQLASGNPVVKVSALQEQGITDLRELIYNTLTAGTLAFQEHAIITNERHYQALQKAFEALLVAQGDLTTGFSEEVVLVNLHAALQCLGIITGETLIGDIINQIFSKFCIGK